MLLPFEGITPRVAPTAWVAASASVIGDVTLGDHVSVWPGAVIRGDTAPITIGAWTNIQDNCVIHADRDEPVTIGAHVTVGHMVMIHCREIGDCSLIGISSTLLTRARVGASCIVAAGAVVLEGADLPAATVWAGVPAKLRGPVDYQIIDPIAGRAAHYAALAERHRANGT